MFSGLLFVRVKAAEQALRNNRLDEAYRLASQPDIAAHPRGAKLLAGVATALLERARAHYRADQFTEALLDLNKAQACSDSHDPQIAELRGQILTVADEVARQEADRRNRVEEARRRLMGGSLVAGQRLIESAAADGADVAGLEKEIARKQRQAGELLSEVEAAMKQDRLAVAVDRLMRAQALDAHSELAARLENQLCEMVLRQAYDAVQAGRLKAAREALDSLKTLGREHARRVELGEILDAAAAAARAIDAARFDQAQPLAHRLQTLGPKAAWIAQAVKSLDQIDAALLALRAGPLGEPFGGDREAGAAPPPAGDVALAETVALGARGPLAEAARPIPQRLLVLIEGGGSYLLYRGQRLSIGRAASDHPADLPIFSDLSERHADIARVEDDYFILSAHDVEVSGRQTRHGLLRDRDRIVLGRRAKLTFHKPNRKSPSGTLDTSDSTKVPNDVRRVILFRESAMIGRGPNCHVTCHSAARDLVLFERGGALWIRPRGRLAGDTAVPVELGKAIDMEGVSMTVKAWTVQAPGSSRLV